MMDTEVVAEGELREWVTVHKITAKTVDLLVKAHHEYRAIIGPRVGTIVHTRTSGRRLQADSLPHV